MRLGLLGYPVEHSLSPKLYRTLLGDGLTSYELFSYPHESQIPHLDYFSGKLNGLNITSPYKTHFVDDVIIESDLVKKMGAINTIAFTPRGNFATNTDVLAVVEILRNYKKKYRSLHLIILGSGVMAGITTHVAGELGVKFSQLSRKDYPGLADLDLRIYRDPSVQNIVINACSRDFVFHGLISSDDIFWDYNYSFLPHQKTLPKKVKLYQDGQGMLEVQALAAVNFWKENNR